MGNLPLNKIMSLNVGMKNNPNAEKLLKFANGGMKSLDEIEEIIGGLNLAS
eukprot:CAMPEP_0170508510 /NCGR_PEP_ID=MMETSP0208-20121228/62564_1 /TAXON_ID=197538 /ORGANISM="Strombidium inclinatum, Strain S3" /LENGTH=50 /DNA_ID=CAMNT_0010791447 /DNA_START=177 /DNA_END=329 /DNA_ORIENTATION=+